MCGLYGGAATHWNAAKLNVVTELAIINTTRGMDATGLFSLFTEEVEIKGSAEKEKKTFFQTAKKGMDALTFLSSTAAKNILTNKDRDNHVIAGHNRWATVGKLNDHNAHPFQFKDIVGMHNGTIHNFDDKKYHNIGSDSAVLFHKIANDGLIPALQEARWGAWAICYLEKSTGLVRFIRNKDRPLHLATSKNKKTIFWSSERRHLEFALAGELEAFDIEELPTEILLTLDPKTMEMEREDLEDEIFPFKNSTYQGSYPEWWRESYADQMKEDIREDLEKELNKTKPEARVLPAISHSLHESGVEIRGYQGFRGHFMTLKEATMVLAEGCVNCGEQTEPDDRVNWVDHSSYICDKCMDEGHLQQYASEQGFPVTRFYKFDEDAKCH